MMLISEFGSSPAPEWNFARWCWEAANAGADAVKVQLFRAEHFPLAEHAGKLPLEFPRERLPEFVAAAHALGLTAGASVFDADAVDLAARHCDWLKLAAREQDNIVLAKHTFERAWDYGRKKIFRSISVLDSDKFFCAGAVVHLYAIPRYPTPMIAALIGIIQAARLFRRWPHIAGWGWSSHTTGIADCVLAARLGASVVEKHLAIAPDNIEVGHSLSPAQFKRLAAALHR